MKDILKVRQWALVKEKEIEEHCSHFHKLFNKGSHETKVRLRCLNSCRNYKHFQKN